MLARERLKGTEEFLLGSYAGRKHRAFTHDSLILVWNVSSAAGMCHWLSAVLSQMN